MDENLLKRAVISTEIKVGDIFQALGSIKPIEDKPVIVNGEYLGNLNGCSGSIDIDMNLTEKNGLQEIIDEAIDRRLLKGVDIRVDTGAGQSIYPLTQIIMTHGIKNIYRKRKGKRYIIQFEYTGEVNVEGRLKYYE